MDETIMRRRLAEARVARLATVGTDGRPHIVPCCFAVEHDTAYSAVDGKPKSTRALRRLTNLRTHPAATLLVDFYQDHDWEALWWIRIDVNGRVLDHGEEFDRAVQALRSKYEQYRREAPAGPVVALDITAWRAWP
jgi:PPOX class probable F420-dependent enzyme